MFCLSRVPSPHSLTYLGGWELYQENWKEVRARAAQGQEEEASGIKGAQHSRHICTCAGNQESPTVNDEYQVVPFNSKESPLAWLEHQNIKDPLFGRSVFARCLSSLTHSLTYLVPCFANLLAVSFPQSLT